MIALILGKTKVYMAFHERWKQLAEEISSINGERYFVTEVDFQGVLTTVGGAAVF